MTPAQPVNILIVDDEPVILNLLKETLEAEGYAAVGMESPRAALQLLTQQDFAVIISDQRMPEMMGLDFLVETRKLRPHASRILITAVVSLPTLVDAINKGEIYRFVAKPWPQEELLATVKTAVQRHHLVQENVQLVAETRLLNDRLLQANEALARQIDTLEAKKKALDAANLGLAENFEHSLELCRRILGTYDPYLGDKTKAMVEIAHRMAETDYFTTDERHVLKTSAWLCDIGLIGIHRDLLNTFRSSPGRLTDRERASIQLHPIYSQTLASFIDEQPALGETIRAHHERFDGKGYPDGLTGGAIPWTARCLAVAVAFVECGLPKQEAIEYVVSISGKALDPEAVRLFLKITHLVQLPRQRKEVMLEELKPGMVLATGLYSPHGLLLVSEGQVLTSNTLGKISNHNLISPISQRLMVYTS